ncbi:MAG: hypothetical protein KF908_03060 [Nitrosomonas sp.]|nr:hypothetical protein [Nitrosomonas sp.]MCW5608855.1 hypothetical protein [Nitrosomonas sp.]
MHHWCIGNRMAYAGNAIPDLDEGFGNDGNVINQWPEHGIDAYAAVKTAYNRRIG